MWTNNEEENIMINFAVPNPKDETRFEAVCRTLAAEAEVKGKRRLAEEFRHAKGPNDLSEKAYKLFQKEMAALEADVNGN